MPSMMMIRRLQLAHTLVCALRILQQPCRGFSGDNSMLTVGTHVGVFPRIGNGHAVASLIMIRSLQGAHASMCSHRICNSQAVAPLMINRSLQWAHTLVCAQHICQGHAVASLMINRSSHGLTRWWVLIAFATDICRCFSVMFRRWQWAHTLVFSQRVAMATPLFL
jgi:hypothetical protein